MPSPRVPPRRSAGLLVYRRVDGRVEVLVGHMGGPYWAGKDAGAWSIPKGEYEESEQPLAAARREFAEELGLEPPDGELLELGTATQSSGKVVTVWAVEGDVDLDGMVPGTFAMEWPPRSGRLQEFPEIDRAAWVDVADAARLLVPRQRPFVERLAERLGVAPTGQAG